MKRKSIYTPPWPRSEEPLESTFTQEEYDSVHISDEDLAKGYAEFLAKFKAKKYQEFDDQQDASFVLSRVWDGSWSCDDIMDIDNPKDSDCRKATICLDIHDPKAKLKDITPTVKCKIRREDGIRRLYVELSFTDKKFNYKQKMLSDVCEPCSKKEFEKFMKFEVLRQSWHKKEYIRIMHHIGEDMATAAARKYDRLHKGMTAEDNKNFENLLKRICGS